MLNEPQNAPELTPEEIAQMQQVQQPPVAPAGIPNANVAQNPMEQEAGINPEDIASAKQMLGLDVLENQLKFDKNVANVLQDFPELNKQVIEDELAKVEEQDPEMAKQFRTSEIGMKTFAKGLMQSIKPEAKPDTVTDDAMSSNQGASAEDDLANKVNAGKANKIELGTYLGSLATKVDK